MLKRLSILLVPALAALGWGPASAAGTADAEPIVVGSISDNDVGGADVTAFVTGVEMWAAEQNDKGGLMGRPVEVRSCFTESDPARAAQCANDFAADPAVLAFVGGASTQWTTAISPVAERAGLLQIPSNTYSLGQLSLPNHFVPFAGHPGFLATVPRYLIEERGLTNLAVIRFDIGVTVENAEYARQAAEAVGGTVVADIPVAPTTADYLPAVTQAAAQGAEVILPALGSAGIVAMFEAINSGGFADQLSVALGPSQAFEASVVEAVGDVQVFTDLDHTLLIEGSPGSDDYQAVVDQYEPEVGEVDAARLAMGYVAGRSFAAIAEHAGPELSRESILEAAGTAEIELPGYPTPLSLSSAPPEHPAVAVRQVLIAEGLPPVIVDGPIDVLATQSP